MPEPFTWQEVEIVLNDVRLMARKLLLKETAQYSWRPTALVNEALRRLHERDGEWQAITWENKTHFFCACRRAMQSSLIDRHRTQSKLRCVSFDEIQEVLSSPHPEHFLYHQPDIYHSFSSAIIHIDQSESILAEILEYRFVLGLSLAEIAVIIGKTDRQARRLFAKASQSMEQFISEKSSEATNVGWVERSETHQQAESSLPEQ